MTGLDNIWLTQITLIMMLTFCDLLVAFTSRMSLVVENRREVCAETYKRSKLEMDIWKMFCSIDGSELSIIATTSGIWEKSGNFLE
jgi:hypothetical protein